MLKLGFILKSNLILKLGFILKLNLIPKLVFILKLNLILKLGFILKFVYIQNFELILNILEHPKPSISSLKQPWLLFGNNSIGMRSFMLWHDYCKEKV